MAQNFAYTPKSAIETVHQIGLGGVPDMGLKNLVFGRVFLFNNLMRKASTIADVFYLTPFEGKVSLNHQDPFRPYGAGHLLGDYSSDSDWVNVIGFRVYAVDPLLKVRKWAKKVVLGGKNADELSTDFAREVADKYGKVAILDSPSSSSERGLFSVYFPSAKKGYFSGVISREEDRPSFEKDLASLLEMAHRQT